MTNLEEVLPATTPECRDSLGYDLVLYPKSGYVIEYDLRHKSNLVLGSAGTISVSNHMLTTMNMTFQKTEYGIYHTRPVPGMIVPRLSGLVPG